MSTIRQNLLQVDTAEIVTPQLQNGASSMEIQTAGGSYVCTNTTTGIVSSANTASDILITPVTETGEVQISSTNLTGTKLYVPTQNEGKFVIEIVKKSGSTTVHTVDISGLGTRTGIAYRDINSAISQFLVLNENEETSYLELVSGVPRPLKSYTFLITWNALGTLNAGSDLALRFETAGGSWGSYFAPYTNTIIYAGFINMKNNSGSGLPPGGIIVTAYKNNVATDVLMSSTSYTAFTTSISIDSRRNVSTSLGGGPYPEVYAKNDFLQIMLTGAVGSTTANSLFWQVDLILYMDYD